MINRNQNRPDTPEIRIVPESELSGEGQAKPQRRPRRKNVQPQKKEEGEKEASIQQDGKKNQRTARANSQRQRSQKPANAQEKAPQIEVIPLEEETIQKAGKPQQQRRRSTGKAKPQAETAALPATGKQPEKSQAKPQAQRRRRPQANQNQQANQRQTNLQQGRQEANVQPELQKAQENSQPKNGANSAAMPQAAAEPQKQQRSRQRRPQSTRRTQSQRMQKTEAVQETAANASALTNEAQPKIPETTAQPFAEQQQADAKTTKGRTPQNGRRRTGTAARQRTQRAQEVSAQPEVANAQKTVTVVQQGAKTVQTTEIKTPLLEPAKQLPAKMPEKAAVEKPLPEKAAAQTDGTKQLPAKQPPKPLTGKNQMVDLKGFLEGIAFHPEAHKNELPPVLSEMQEELDLLEGRGKKARRTSKKKESAKAPKHLRIIPLGGLEQIGMNITAFEYGDSIIVVDCGMAFPEDDMLGIDLVIPDISYLKKNMSKVKGFFITHGHEDHIGALPYVLRELNVPVYSTKLTIALIVNKLREAELLDSAKLNVVKHGDIVPAGDFQIEFIKTNHSIQDASALAIHCPAGVVLHTGDFKVDYTPVFGDVIDLQRFAELGRQGVLAVMADSTNALRPGFTMSERTVGHTFDTIFAEHPKNRIIIATFASNVDRVQQVINDAEKYDRKVVIEGRSMVNVIGTAAELGYIKIKDGTLIDISQLKDYPPEKTVLVTTGSQGEAMAALSRMASGQHRKVSIMPNDVIVLSSNPIPGNEKAVAKVINELAQKHAEVINQDTHVSGHACQEELKLIYSLVRPKYAIPVHGEYRHRIAQRNIAESVGIPHENILIAETGDVIELGEDCCKITDHVQAGPVMVDGLGVGDVGNIVLRDRQNLAQNGIIIVVLALEKYSGRLVAGPDIVSRGFVYVRENEELMEEARVAVLDAVDDCLVHHVSDWSRIKNVIRDTLSDFLWRRMKRTPVILPIISEV